MSGRTGRRIKRTTICCAGMLALIAGTVSYRRRARPAVVIDAPTSHQLVTQTVTARGTARRIPDGVALWLIVSISGRLYPQGKILLPPGGTGRCRQDPLLAVD